MRAYAPRLARRETTSALRPMRAYAPRLARRETTSALRPMRAYAPRLARRETTSALRPMRAYAPRRRAPRDHVRAAADESLCSAPIARRKITSALLRFNRAAKASRPEVTIRLTCSYKAQALPQMQTAPQQHDRDIR